MGRANEITRDELKFTRFVNRLRTKFSELFITILERQLLLKGVITRAEWNDMKDIIKFDFIEDNYFAEIKEGEVLRERLGLLRDIEEYAGKYFSNEYIRKTVLRQTEEDIKQEDKQIEKEKAEAPEEEDDDVGF
jgi:hypothetical protein